MVWFHHPARRNDGGVNTLKRTPLSLGFEASGKKLHLSGSSESNVFLEDVMEYRFLTRPEVETLTKLSRSSIYRLIRSKPPKFPLPIRISSRAVRWRESEIRDYIDSRPRATGELGRGK